MAIDNMTAEQITEALDDIGETGRAQIRRGNELHIQREENSDWWFYGTVDDADYAQKIIDEYFDH